jgi:GTP-binding protein Era
MKVSEELGRPLKDSGDKETFKSGYVSLIGRPNVGKSTLLNSMLGEKVAIVTPKPQTTRNRIRGIKNLPNAQIVFIDTPGIHRPREKLGEFMVKEATLALKEVELVVLMVEPRLPEPADERLVEVVKTSRSRFQFPVILAINKIDTVKKSELLPVIDDYSKMMDFSEIIPISALKGDGLDILLQKVVEYLPEGPKYYPDDMVTDQLERFMVAEIIREKIINLTKDEIPYSVAVEVSQWQEKEGIIIINANIYVEKDTQKGIIIGKKGAKLKSIGTEARKEIEALLGTKVYLELWVKVKEAWRKKPGALRELGYQ